jgi:hypothetical protein
MNFTDGNIPSVYTKEITVEKKKELKQILKVRWRVIYTNGITKDINTIGKIRL